MVQNNVNIQGSIVLITGIAGFIGSNLAKRLIATNKDITIVGIDNLGVNVYVDNLPYIGIGLSVFYYICNADHTSWSDKMKENNIYSNLLTLILIL